MIEIKRSPIFYMGNKHKLLKQLLPLFPERCETFVDAFGGSGVVSMNYKGSYQTIYNEINENIIGLVKMVKEEDLFQLNLYYEEKIERYDLRKKSNKQNPELNKSGYLKLRKEYNDSEKRDYKDLFLLMCYSINHLLRFNQKNEFNVSNGNDSYNDKNFQQLKDMQESFKNVIVLNKDVFNLDFDSLTENDFVYFDPPYLNTTAVYNEKGAFGGWNIECDYKLFEICERLHKKGVKWGMSNVFENRGIKNDHLIEWCQDKGWYVHHLNRNYNPFSRGNSNNDEVYICDYTDYEWGEDL